MKPILRRLVNGVGRCRSAIARMASRERTGWQSTFECRLRALEMAVSSTELRAVELVTAQELLRIYAQIKALEAGTFVYASKAELSDAVTASAARIEALRLLLESESNEAGAHRSYLEREFARSAQEINVDRERIDAALSANVERLNELEATLRTKCASEDSRMTTEALGGRIRLFNHDSTPTTGAEPS